MSNPEFKRNLWLSFSLHRLIGMPVLLALIFMTAAFANVRSEVANSLYTISVMLFIFIVWLWGARNANAAIVDELRDKTWDQQRMSALDPWTMTWGKLLGSTSFNWYGGLMCLAIITSSGFAADKPHVLAMALTLCAIGVLLHGALIALNLHTSQFETRIVQRGGIGWLVIIFVFIMMPTFSINEEKPFIWWGMEIDHALFWLYSTVLFAACTTFAAWRVICNALQVRTLPWAWPAFACLLAFYCGGFLNSDEHIRPLLLTGLFVAVTMSYATLLTEPNTLLRWRKLRLLQSRGDWRGWLEHLPLWPTTLLLSFLFALLLMLIPGDEFNNQQRLAFLQPQHALTVALMLLRDASLLLFFAFSPKSTRAIAAAIMYLLVLNILLPFLAGVAELDTLRYFLLPFDAARDPWSSVLAMTVHAAVAIGLVNWRLRNTG